VIDHTLAEREAHDDKGAKFGQCCVGLAFNATMSMSQEDGKASLNESTQSLLIITAFDLLEVLQSLRASRDETKETPVSFCMGAFAADSHPRYLVLRASRNEAQRE